MDKAIVARNTKELAELLCLSEREVWDFHTDEDIKNDFTFDEIMDEIKKRK